MSSSNESDQDRRRPLAETLPAVETLGSYLYGPSYVKQVKLSGSLRRFRETVGDLGILVASDSPTEVLRRFATLEGVQEVTDRGETKISVRTERGLKVGLRVVKPEQFGAACLYYTGSKAHNKKLRMLALERGWLLNEYGLSESETGKVLASETEEAIYEALGLEFIPAPMREDYGEIELALEGRLPRSVAYEDVQGDLHLRTQLPDTTRGTVEDLVMVAAEERGYDYLALIDDSGGEVSTRKLGHQPNEIAAIQKSHPRMTLLHGALLDIRPDGSLVADPSYYRELDWRVASVRSDFDLDSSKQTKRILAAMENPLVDAIAHPTGRQLGARPASELDFDAVFRKAAETGTALEITALLDRLDPPSDALLLARDLDVTFILTSEAQTPPELRRVYRCVRQAQRGWVGPDRIANCWPRDKFLSWLKRRR